MGAGLLSEQNFLWPQRLEHARVTKASVHLQLHSSLDSWVVHPLGRKTAELSQIGLRLEHKVKAMPAVATTAVPSIEQQLAPSTFGMHEFAHFLLTTASAPLPRPQSDAIFRFVRPWPALSGLLAGFLATLSESQSESIRQIVHLWARIAAKSS